jgi:mannose-6-phosphate isomerase-like protein (cupin superfamily)
MPAVNLDAALATIHEHWQPHRVVTINDYDMKLAKVQGEFIWHAHPATDELFLVLSGELTLQLRDGDVVLGPNDVYVVPKGVEHCPTAEVETAIVMFEIQGTVNTGTAGGDRTATLQELA